ncbi:3-hydroxyacyl-ACP dehydratase FabZ family protein [Skermanella stibiiresistens]|uniref:3-hydroxyacyl-ACP dehydratase FabZ family protein n=1 Tax=Skermanella stibiiresistens TaxID=913326 RepID=UPI0009FDA578|nr:hypothetical protein [Skermanella stibiiresistens]
MSIPDNPAPGNSVPAGVIPRDWPIDRVVEREPGRKCVALKYLSFSDPIFTEHFPGMPIYPGSMVLNSVFATGRAMMEGGPAAWRVAGVKRAAFRRPSLPGRVLTIIATVDAEIPPGAMAEVRYSLSDGHPAPLGNGAFLLEPVAPLEPVAS